MCWYNFSRRKEKNVEQILYPVSFASKPNLVPRWRRSIRRYSLEEAYVTFNVKKFPFIAVESLSKFARRTSKAATDLDTGLKISCLPRSPNCEIWFSAKSIARLDSLRRWEKKERNKDSNEIYIYIYRESSDFGSRRGDAVPRRCC